jgi:RNA polymerase sigma-70 factor, ECF subfamily
MSLGTTVRDVRARTAVVNQMPSDVYSRESRDAAETDDVLVRAASQGDRQAFALLYHRHKQAVWNLAYLTMRNRQEAEDCLQETFVRALRALRSDPRVEKVGPWLLTICRNACLDRLRALSRRQVVSLEDGEVAGVAAQPADQDLSIDLRRALDSLAPEDREAFVLVDVLGCRSHEAASILGLRASSTLRARLARARRQLYPAVADADQSDTEVWGLYHRPPESAIVVSFGARAGNRDGDPNLQELIARLEQPVRSNGRNGFQLAEFFDRLDGQIPHERSVIAVLDARPFDSAQTTHHWLADHPRWQARRSTTHAAWLLEVRRLLSSAAGRRGDRQAAALAALDAPNPFFWSPSR